MCSEQLKVFYKWNQNNHSSEQLKILISWEYSKYEIQRPINAFECPNHQPSYLQPLWQSFPRCSSFKWKISPYKDRVLISKLSQFTRLQKSLDRLIIFYAEPHFMSTFVRHLKQLSDRSVLPMHNILHMSKYITMSLKHFHMFQWSESH